MSGGFYVHCIDWCTPDDKALYRMRFVRSGVEVDALRREWFRELGTVPAVIEVPGVPEVLRYHAGMEAEL